MDECNSIKHDFHKTPNIYPNISKDQQFRLNKINEIKGYFIAEIKERELMSKNLSKYIASFEYLDKSLIVLSVATGSISIASFATAIGAPVGIMSASCSIESKISEALINNEISHEDFMTILNEEKKYRELKESIRMMNSHRSDAEKVSLIEEGKKIGINEVIKHNEIINNSLK